MDNMLTVSSSPHLRDEVSVKKIMWTVGCVLLPAVAFGVYKFGIGALLVVLTCVIAAVASEYVSQKVLKKKVTIDDGSAFVTGLLLAMTLPPNLPLYMAALGSIFAIVVCKHTMGGLGYNIFNPALAARAALIVSWPVAMTTWTDIKYIGADAVSKATPLGVASEEGFSSLMKLYNDSPMALYTDMLFGMKNGSLGEISAILIAIGGCYLLYKKYIKWQIPVITILSVAVFGWMFTGETLFTGDPIFNVLSGGVILGAFFMATDYVTAPMTSKGQIIFAVGVGAITIIIRTFGAYPEGVCYAILLMNSLTPIIDRYTKPRIFGVARRAA